MTWWMWFLMFWACSFLLVWLKRTNELKKLKLSTWIIIAVVSPLFIVMFVVEFIKAFRK